MGDGGAYVLGHFLVWSAILIINYDFNVSPFAVLLIFFWPLLTLDWQYGDAGS